MKIGTLTRILVGVTAVLVLFLLPSDTIKTLTSTMVPVAAVPAILLPIVYWTGSPWRSTLVGKMMMNKMVAIAIIFVIIVLSLWLGASYPFRDELRLAGYFWLDVALWAQLLVLLTIQRRARRGDYDRADVSTSPARDGDAA